MAAVNNQNKPNPKAMAKAMDLAAGSKSTQLEAQRISPAIAPNAPQFNAQTPNVVPGGPNAAAQGIKDLYAPVEEDWFWNNWMNNAKANGMQSGTRFQEGGVMPNLGKVFVPESYWDYAQKKREQAFQEDFNRFVFSQFNVSKPEARQWWEKKFPGYTKSVYDAYATKMQVEAKLAEIQIKGFQNEGDLWFAYQYQNGYFDRMLAPSTERLVPMSDADPSTTTTNPTINNNSVPPNAITWKMPAIP